MEVRNANEDDRRRKLRKSSGRKAPPKRGAETDRFTAAAKGGRGWEGSPSRCESASTPWGSIKSCQA